MGVWRASLVTVAVLLGVCVGGSVHAAEQGFPQVTLRAPVADVVVAGDVVTFKGVAKGAFHCQLCIFFFCKSRKIQRFCKVNVAFFKNYASIGRVGGKSEL